MDAGLSQVLSDVPVRSGYAELSAGFDNSLGGWARGEVGVHLAPQLAVFGFSQESQAQGFSAGAGARLNFNL